MTDKTLIDIDYFWRAVANDSGLAAQVLESFTRSGDESMALLQAAETYPAFKSAAHRLKGAARSIGARPLARQAEMAELAKDAPDGRQAVRARDALKAQWAQVRAEASAMRRGID